MLYLQSTLVLTVTQKWKEKTYTRFSHTLIIPKGPWPNSPELGCILVHCGLVHFQKFPQGQFNTQILELQIFFKYAFYSISNKITHFLRHKSRQYLSSTWGLKTNKSLKKKTMVNVWYKFVNMKLHIFLVLNTSCTSLLPRKILA